MGEAQGKKIASKPLRGPGRGAQRPHRGARSASQRPAWTRGHQQSAKESTGSDALTRRCDVTAPARSAIHQRSVLLSRANEKRPPRPCWRQRRSAVGSDRDRCQILESGGISLSAAMPVWVCGRAKLRISRSPMSTGETVGLPFCGKSRRAEWLPLTQEVGDAIVTYLERARPRLRTPRL